MSQTAEAASGFEKKCPCPRSQSSARSWLDCSTVSMPSPVTARFRLFAISKRSNRAYRTRA
jgi:hypothetical protein